MEVLWFGYMDEIVYNGDDIVLDELIDFKPMKRLEYWGDVKMFRSASIGRMQVHFEYSGIFI